MASTPISPGALKIGHWTMYNGSGMNNVAVSMVEAERKLGLNSHLCNLESDAHWEYMLDCDVHVSHTHFPELYRGKSLRRQLTKPFRSVWIGHGTPEHIFQESVIVDANKNYGAGDGLMLQHYWLQKAHARVTFWPRHRRLYETMVDTGTTVHCIPLGVDRDFWSAGASRGKYAGTPSLWSGENSHYIKWPLDLIQMWPLVYPELDGGSLHLSYLPTDQHRWFAPLINRNGAGYAMHWSSVRWGADDLRNIFKSVDFFIGLVRYGDFNRLSLEANAAGATTISYPGNPYSDYWIPEGDHRMMAAGLLPILKGDVAPRKKTPVPSYLDTARAMQAIYESIL